MTKKWMNIVVIGSVLAGICNAKPDRFTDFAKVLENVIEHGQQTKIKKQKLKKVATQFVFADSNPQESALYKAITKQNINKVRELLKANEIDTFLLDLNAPLGAAQVIASKNEQRNEVFELLLRWKKERELRNNFDPSSVFFGWNYNPFAESETLFINKKKATIFEWLVAKGFDALLENMLFDDKYQYYLQDAVKNDKNMLANAFEKTSTSGAKPMAKTVFNAIDIESPWQIAWYIKAEKIDPFNSKIKADYKSDKKELNVFEYYFTKKHELAFADFYKKYGKNASFDQIFPTIKTKLIQEWKTSTQLDWITVFWSLMSDSEKNEIATASNQATKKILSDYFKNTPDSKYFTKVESKEETKEKIEEKPQKKTEEKLEVKIEEKKPVEEETVQQGIKVEYKSIEDAVKKLTQVFKSGRQTTMCEQLALRKVCEKLDSSIIQYSFVGTLIDPAIKNEDIYFLQELLRKEKPLISLDTLLKEIDLINDEENETKIRNIIRFLVNFGFARIEDFEEKLTLTKQKREDFLREFKIEKMNAADAIASKLKTSKFSIPEETFEDKFKKITFQNAASLKTSGEGRQLPLLPLVAALSDLGLIKRLVEMGINFDVVIDGYTPLFESVKERNLVVCDYLLERGMSSTINFPVTKSIHATDKGTPLSSAACDGDVMLAKLLFKHGANPNIKVQGYTVLMERINHLSWLNTHTPSANAQAIKSTKDVIKLLLENGADYGEKKYENKTPWEFLGFKTKQAWFADLSVDEKKVKGMDQSITE